jgi:hypothetical protein
METLMEIIIAFWFLLVGVCGCLYPLLEDQNEN